MDSDNPQYNIYIYWIVYKPKQLCMIITKHHDHHLTTVLSPLLQRRRALPASRLAARAGVHARRRLETRGRAATHRDLDRSPDVTGRRCAFYV